MRAHLAPWAWLLLCASGALAAPEAPTLALLDFDTSASPRACGWAARALPDLLQIPLQHADLRILDRQLLDATLQEQRLGDSGLAGGAPLRTAGLLGAQWLLTGRFALDAADRFQLSARITSVGTLETKGESHRAGTYPDDLAPALQSLAGEIAALCATPSAAVRPHAPAAAIPQTEALIMFHRGLESCARGGPAVGSVWFGKALAHDPHLRAAGRWEIKAYDSAGLAAHAALAREMFNATNAVAPAAPDLAAGGAGVTLAVLEPVVPRQRAGAPAPALLRSALEQGVLATEGVRLVHPEGLAAAAAETDLELTGRLRADHASRYGNWLTAERVIVSTIPPDASPSLQLYMVETASGRLLRHVAIALPADGFEARVADAARILLQQDATQVETAPAPPPFAPASSAASPDLLNGLLPDEVHLAGKLQELSQHPDQRATWLDLATLYGRLPDKGRYRALALAHLVDTLDVNQPDADLDVYELFSCAGLGLAAGLPPGLEPKIEAFLRLKPNTLAAALIRYAQCYRLWVGGKEEEAAADLAGVVWVLNRISPADSLRLLGDSGAGVGTLSHALSCCHYMLGKVAVKRGETALARKEFESALAELRRNRYPNELQLANSPAMSRTSGQPRWIWQNTVRVPLRETLERNLRQLADSVAVADPVQEVRPPAPWIVQVLDRAYAEVEHAQPERERMGRLVDEADRLFAAGAYPAALAAYRKALQSATEFERRAPRGTFGVARRTEEGVLKLVVGPREAIFVASDLDETVIELAMAECPADPQPVVARLAASLDAPIWQPNWGDWFNAAMRRQARHAYEAAACLHRAALDAGVKEYNWQAGPDPAWAQRLRDDAVGRDPERRWFSSAYQLALCLAQFRPEEAAPWLRMLSLSTGSRTVHLYLHILENGYDAAADVRVGEEAAKLLESLHLQGTQAPAAPGAAGGRPAL